MVNTELRTEVEESHDHLLQTSEETKDAGTTE